MILVFNEDFKIKIKAKIKLFLSLLIVSTIIFIIFLLPVIIFYQHLNKYLFIFITTLLSFFYFSGLLILVKGYNHYKKVYHLSLNNYPDKLTGIIMKPDTYQVTIDGLLYHQLSITNSIEQIFYVLYGTDFSTLLNQKVTIYLNHNILYAYEVLDE